MRRFSKLALWILASAFLGLPLVKGVVISQVASATWSPATSMAEARDGASAVLLLDGRILVTGGNSASGPLATAEILSTDGSFSSASPMIVARSKHISVVLHDGRVLVAGGITSGGGRTNAAEIYDPIANSWSSVSSGMTEARSGPTGSLLSDGRVLIAGGASSASASLTVEVFDPRANSFGFAGVMSTPRKDHAAASLADGRVLIIGGSNGSSALASTEIYDPKSKSISQGPSLASPRAGASATSLLDGRVLVAGGNDGSKDLASAEVYDPAAGSWASTASNLATPRRNHLAFRLPNNNGVLIVGGTSATNALSSAELFLPWVGSFGATGSMATARMGAVGSPLGQDGLLLMAGGSGQASAELYGFATVKTDKTDYHPGETVIITGSGWQPGEKVSLRLHEDLDRPFHLDRTLTAVADGSGYIFNNQFSPEHHDIGIRFYLTATGKISQAESTFTDGNPSANLDQCGNQLNPSGTNPCTGAAWINGNLGISKSLYFEGDSIPYRLAFSNLVPGTSYVVTIQWDTTKGGKHALDYITTWDRSALAGSDPCSGLTCASGISTSSIAPDPNVSAANGFAGTQIPGNLTLYGGTITSVSAYHLTGTYAGDSSTAIDISFTPGGTANQQQVLAWGGHIAARQNWGLGNSAVAISGSPYHTRLLGLGTTIANEMGGNQDRSLSAAAVIFPGQITIVKNSNPVVTSAIFPFTASPSPPLSPASFTLTGEGTSTAAGQQVFGNIISFQTYTFAETLSSIPDWTLNSISCVSIGGGIGASAFNANTSTGTASVGLVEGDNVVCTYTDSQKVGSLTVVKSLSPNTDPGLFNLQIDAVTKASNVGDTGTTGAVSVTPGTHTVAETAGTSTSLSNYTSSISCKSNAGAGAVVASGSGTGPLNVPVNSNDNILCTVSNARNTGSLTVVKSLSPNTDPGLFNLQIDAVTKASNVGDTGTTGAVSVTPGTHTVAETAGTSTSLSNYTSSISCKSNAGAGAVVASGSGTGPLNVPVNSNDNILCTVSNTRNTGSLTVVKSLSPNTDPGLFNLQIDAVTKASNVGDTGTTGAVSVTPGTHTVAETAGTSTSLSNYTSSISCKSNAGAGAVVASGSGTGPLSVPVNSNDNILCTVSNTRNTGSLTVVKSLSPNTDPGLFNLQIDAVTKASNVGDTGTTGAVSVTPGTHTVAETAGT